MQCVPLDEPSQGRDRPEGHRVLTCRLRKMHVRPVSFSFGCIARTGWRCRRPCSIETTFPQHCRMYSRYGFHSNASHARCGGVGGLAPSRSLLSFPSIDPPPGKLKVSSFESPSTPRGILKSVLLNPPLPPEFNVESGQHESQQKNNAAPQPFNIEPGG